MPPGIDHHGGVEHVPGCAGIPGHFGYGVVAQLDVAVPPVAALGFDEGREKGRHVSAECVGVTAVELDGIPERGAVLEGGAGLQMAAHHPTPQSDGLVFRVVPDAGGGCHEVLDGYIVRRTVGIEVDVVHGGVCLGSTQQQDDKQNLKRISQNIDTSVAKLGADGWSCQTDVLFDGSWSAGILDIIAEMAPRGAIWDNIYVVKTVCLTINML